jgi:acetyl esterase/lipase
MPLDGHCAVAAPASRFADIDHKEGKQMTSTESHAIRSLFESMISRLTARPDMGLDELREMMEAWTTLAAEPEHVSYREIDADGVPALWCLPADHGPDRAVLYVHGGAYVGGSINSHRKMVGHLAAATGCPALMIDYRRAPEHPPPAQLEDCATAYRWLLQQGCDAQRIVCAGDSAGAALATGLVLKLRDEHTPIPAGIVAISPWYDLEAKGETYETNAGVDSLVGRETMIMLAQLFLAGTSPTDPAVSPLHAELSGLPPTYIVVGGHETLLDDTRQFAKQAGEAGVDVTVVEVPEMQHVFTFMAGRAPEADHAINAIATWTRSRLELD